MTALGLPEDIKAGEVPLVDAQVRATGDVAAIELQAWLQADAPVLRDGQGLQALAVDLPADGPHLRERSRFKQ